MAVFAEIFLAVWMFVFVIWGVKGRWRPAFSRSHPGWYYAPRQQWILRGIGTLILVTVLIDLWFRLTGRGQFLR